MSSLENRGNGSWRLTISDGYAPDGKKIRFQRTIHVDPMHTPAVQRREAEKQAALLEADFRRKLLLTGNRAPLKQVFTEFVEEKQRAGLKASSIRFYTNLFESRILPMLGDMAVQDIDRRTVSRFYSRACQSPGAFKPFRNGQAVRHGSAPISHRAVCRDGLCRPCGVYRRQSLLAGRAAAQGHAGDEVAESV